MRILVFGLPGSGKTTFARELHLSLVGSRWQNGDWLRNHHKDWDFSEEGRIRQLERMIEFSNNTNIAICDFVCPKQEYRDKFNADISIWMNTIEKSIYDDTNSIFEIPNNCNYKIDTFDQKQSIIKDITGRFHVSFGK